MRTPKLRQLAPDTPPFEVRYIDSQNHLVILAYRYLDAALEAARSLIREGCRDVVCSDVLNSQLIDLPT